jgi:hypothetical protein
VCPSAPADSSHCPSTLYPLHSLYGVPGGWFSHASPRVLAADCCQDFVTAGSWTISTTLFTVINGVLDVGLGTVLNADAGGTTLYSGIVVGVRDGASNLRQDTISISVTNV